MATHSNIFAWKIPWTEQPMGSQRVMSVLTEHACMCYHIHGNLVMFPPSGIIFFHSSLLVQSGLF